MIGIDIHPNEVTAIEASIWGEAPGRQIRATVRFREPGQVATMYMDRDEVVRLSQALGAVLEAMDDNPHLANGSMIEVVR